MQIFRLFFGHGSLCIGDGLGRLFRFGRPGVGVAGLLLRVHAQRDRQQQVNQ